jgi:hypothetical protein
MTTEATAAPRVNWSQLSPWLRLGEALSCACSPPQLLLGCSGALVSLLLGGLLSGAWLPRDEGSLVGDREKLVEELSQTGVVGAPVSPTPPVAVEPETQRPIWRLLTDLGVRVPMVDAVLPAVEGVFKGFWMPVIHGVASWSLWSLVGLAICRCTAVQFGRREGPSLRDGGEFAWYRWVTSLLSPIIPAGGSLLLLVMTAILVIPGAIPVVGKAWLLLISPVLLPLGLAAMFIISLLPLLWPNMVASLAADDGDSFDAFSRSFSCVMSRLWLTLGLWLVGLAMILLVQLALLGLLTLTQAGLVWSAGWIVGESTQTQLHGWLVWWSRIVLHGATASLSWSLATIIYLSLREATDGLPLSVIAGTEPEPPRSELPLTGLSAVQPPPPTA